MITGETAVGFLDYSDLQCCDGAMEPCTQYNGHGRPGCKGYGCLACGKFITQMAFLQNHHGTREARRARIQGINATS